MNKIDSTLTYENAMSIFYLNKHWIESESIATVIRIAIGVLWLAMVVLMFIRIKRGLVFHINNIVLILLGILEIFYFMSMGDEAVSFLVKMNPPSQPDAAEVGLTLLTFLLGYVILLFMIAVQFVAVKRTLVDIAVEYDGVLADYRVGLYSMPFAIAGAYFGAMYFSVAVKWILLTLVLCQVIQVGLIIFSLRQRPFAAALSVLVYLLSIGGIVFALSAYFWIIICVIAFMVFGFFMGFSPLGSFKGDYSAYQAKLDRKHEQEMTNWRRDRYRGLHD